MRLRKLMSIFIVVAGLITFCDVFTGKNLLNIQKDLDTPPIKVGASFCFILSGLALCCLDKEPDSIIGHFWIFSLSTIITFIMGMFLLSNLLTIITSKNGILGAEDIFYSETEISPKTIAPNIPSLITILNFLSFAAAITAYRFKNRSPIFYSSIQIFITAIMAIIGFAIGLPLFYFYWPGISSGMSILAASTFLAMATSMMLYYLGNGQC
jgi:hypothetical protein